MRLRVLRLRVLKLKVLRLEGLRLKVLRLKILRLEVLRLEVLRLEGLRLKVLRLEGLRLKVLRLKVLRLEGLRLKVLRLKILRLEVLRLEGLRLKEDLKEDFSFPPSNGAIDKHMAALRRASSSIELASPEELGGMRIEARMRQGDTLEEGGQPITAEDLMQINLEAIKLWDLLVKNGYARIKFIPFRELQEAVRAAWDNFQNGDFPTFQSRRLAYFRLLSLMGHSSEHWNRYILQDLKGEGQEEEVPPIVMKEAGPEAFEEVGLENPGPEIQGPQEAAGFSLAQF